MIFLTSITDIIEVINNHGGVAQLVRAMDFKSMVTGSSPVIPSNKKKMRHLRTEKFDIAYFQNYVATYHERYPDQQNIMFQDMFYGLGICIDPVKYKGADGFRKFIEWIVESYRLDEDEKFMDQMMVEEIKREIEERGHNTKLLDELEKELGEKYMGDIMECLKESEAHGKLEIVDHPDIKPQEEDWGSFDHILVDQYCDGGFTGDEFAGWIYIPVGGKYLKSHYSM